MRTSQLSKMAIGVSATLMLGLSLEVENVAAFVPSSGQASLHMNVGPLNVFTSPDRDKVKEEDVTNDLFDQISEKIGRVDDERIIYPEYDSGEVTRMFSALEYSKSEQDVVRAQHSTGSVFGAASLIAGTMVGAGVLALPTATAPVGFLASSAAMGVGWVYMTMSGLLIAELSINRLGQSGKPGAGLIQLYADSLGPKWSKVGTASYFFLHYAVLVAYIAQGGVNLNGVLSSAGLTGLSEVPGIGQLLFAGTCALGLYTASPAGVVKANNTLVLMLAALFMGIIGLGVGSADLGSLVDMSNQHPELVANALPIIFLSLVYQNVVPTVVNQLEGDRGKIKKAIFAGTSIPTLMFLAWNAVVLGNVHGADLTNIDPVALLQSAEGADPVLGAMVGGFSSLAIITCLIGFVYGLLDALTDVLDLPSEGPTFEKWKAPLFGIIFLPPLALSVTDPDIFYKALDFGGAFGVSSLFLVLPPIMVWAQRYGDEQQPLMTKPMVPFGKLSLGSMWKAAGTLILEQGAEKLGVFEWISQQLT